MEGWGFHFLVSDWPIPERTAQELAAKLGPNATTDFIEWGPEATTPGQFNILLNNEFSVDSIIAASPTAPALHDDRPTNEYFASRYLKSLSSQHELGSARSIVPGETATSTPR
jgi:hypothetical protein